MIQVENVTLQYPGGKGIREVSFQAAEGQVTGYLGPNGAGKTTTIRCLLGFSRPDSGSCSINGLDCWRQAPEIQRSLGCLPGEIAFLDGMTGRRFLQFMSRMRAKKDSPRQRELEEIFEIDLSGRIKRYSKGMKQKVGIIAAFMSDPQVIILDEPTSGLDPLMQNQRKSFVLRLAHPEQASCLARLGCDVQPLPPDGFKIGIPREQLRSLLELLARLDVISLESKSQSLEEIFLHPYDGEEKT